MKNKINETINFNETVNFPEPSRIMHVTTDNLESLLWLKSERRFAKKYNVVEELIVSPGTQSKPIVKYCDARYFTNLKKVVLEEGIERIDSFAFYRSTIRSIKIPSTIKNISYSAFSKSAIENIEWPDKVDGLVTDGCDLYYTFDRCVNLKELIFPEGTTYVATPTFFTPNIERIHLPSSVKNVYGGCFDVRYVPSLKKLTWGDRVLIDADKGIDLKAREDWDVYMIKDNDLLMDITTNHYRKEHMEQYKKECLDILA